MSVTQKNQTRSTVELVLVVVLVFVWLLCTNISVMGATEQFTVQSLVGSDTNPPTTPTGLVATPVATSQIELTWASSTDDVLLSGYQVWRDDFFIATTTAPAYSDVGLIASTTYAYYVTAFDSSFNISASSTVVFATTLSSSTPTSTPTTTEPRRFGSLIRPLADELKSLEIFPQRESVSIRYETNGYVRTVIKWGKTASYELGSLAERAFSTRHETAISGLIPNTTYSFVIEGENRYGRYGVMYVGTFTTLPPSDTFPPANVTNLKAVKDGDDIVLSWTNPKDPDLAKVRVVRSDKFYPSDIADGWVVYEGLGAEVLDRGVALQGERQFYTVFSYDALGNISSGAVVSVVLRDGEIFPGDTIDPSLNEISLSFRDIDFIQEGVPIIFEEDRIFIDGAKQLTISIPYERLPEHLKTILVIIGDAFDKEKTFMFLLRINAEKTAYTGIIAPLARSGSFPMQVSVFDFKTAQVGYASGTLVSQVKSLEEREEGFFVGFFEYLFSFSRPYTYALWFVIFLALLALMGRRLMRTQW